MSVIGDQFGDSDRAFCQVCVCVCTTTYEWNNLLTVPKLSLALSAKAFCVSGPPVWNSLSNNCKQAELVTTFKRKLKSELFYLAYREQSSV